MSTTFSEQPPETTPVGNNCRVFEMLTQRGRGGSRAGYSRYIPAQVSGNNPVQHLAVLVSCGGSPIDAQFLPIGFNFPGWSFTPNGFNPPPFPLPPFQIPPPVEGGFWPVQNNANNFGAVVTPTTAAAIRMVHTAVGSDPLFPPVFPCTSSASASVNGTDIFSETITGNSTGVATDVVVTNNLDFFAAIGLTSGSSVRLNNDLKVSPTGNTLSVSLSAVPVPPDVAIFFSMEAFIYTGRLVGNVWQVTFPLLLLNDDIVVSAPSGMVVSFEEIAFSVSAVVSFNANN